MRRGVACLVLLLGIFGGLQAGGVSWNLIPEPASVELVDGQFLLSGETRVYVPGPFLKNLGPYLVERAEKDTGLHLQIAAGDPDRSSNSMVFETVDDPALGDEGYLLRISPSKIQISAKGYAGLFYGFQTLRQMIPVSTNWEGRRAVEIPCVAIRDQPCFEWRGVMIDVARHFRTKEFIERQIDVFASYKINKFHWHLTDDQGWRVEVKQYPNLTRKGAWRADRTGIPWWSREPAMPEEPKTVGGYYSQADIRGIIEYARIRNVEIIPEIDVPGHSQALIAAYPDLYCSKEAPFEVNPGGKPQHNALCVGKESTYAFMEGVLGEVAELFPSRYIHIGGDEVNKRAWQRCPDCQRRMKENHLDDVSGLQDYFISRMQQLLAAKGRALIGWDEIIANTDHPGAVIMAWRVDQKNHIKAAREGYPTIMASYRDSYISQRQGPPELEPEGPNKILPLSKVYHYDPIPDELTPEESRRVLGTQVCLWSEFVPTAEHAEYMLYPRTLANAEVGWSQPERKDWARFQKAVEAHFSRLDRDGVNYSTSLYNVTASVTPDPLHDETTVTLRTESLDAEIFYTIDSGEPSARAHKYTGVFQVMRGSVIKAALFDRQGRQLGKVTEVEIK